MNKNILKTFLVGTATLSLASCSENTWNEHFLKGFETGVDYENGIYAEAGSYALTADDYKAISKLMEAKATNDEEKAEAKAIATNCYFNKFGTFPAAVALPPFFETSTFPYYLAPNSSYADVSYAEVEGEPEELTAISGANQYTVKADDYKAAWGSDTDFITAFAPMTPASAKLPDILKNAYPDATEGTYAIVKYNESATNPIFSSISDPGEAEKFVGGTFYIVADGAHGVAPIPLANKPYGYLPSVDVTVTDGSAVANEINAFNFIPTEGGYYIKDAYGRYVYQTGTYNNFNLSYNLPESGAVWTVEVGNDGQATITNTSVGKWLQYDNSHNNWGSYDSAKGSLPILYKAPSPKYYLVTEDGHGAGPIASNKTFGNLAGVDMTVDNGAVINADPANTFTFEITDGGYYIIDSYGRYIYQKGTYNNFNVSAEIPEEGGIWTLTGDANGYITIKNVSVNKWLQYDSDYNNWGSYDTEKGKLPKMYNAAAIATPANRPAKIVAGTPATSSINAVYYYNGSDWAVATGVSALNAADYQAMGFKDADLKSPEIYLPFYLKKQLPYAQSGDMQIVVYNSNKTAMCVYNGSEWTLNNNGLENVVGRFTKSSGTWNFTKYIGKAIFTFFPEDQIIRDRSYLIAYENICASPLPKSDRYGYLMGSSFNADDETIVLPSDANAYAFISKVNVDDKEYKAPEEKFLIMDSNSRYVYMSGTFKSFNVQDTPDIADGKIASNFLWTATKDADGNWTIKNVGSSEVRIWGYSTSHGSYGAYDSMNETTKLPVLYIMTE